MLERWLLPKDGVIKYNIPSFEEKAPLLHSIISDIDPIRNLMFNNNFIGVSAKGESYGCVAQRLPPFDGPIGKRRFVVTGTDTGKLPRLTNKHYAIVAAYDAAQNLVIPEAGIVKPSSETMTLAAVFDQDDKIRTALHGHIANLWKNARKMGIPITSKNVAYGTTEMVEEVKRLFKETWVIDVGIFAMGGHEDGLITFGKTPKDAWDTMLRFAQLSGKTPWIH